MRLAAVLLAFLVLAPAASAYNGVRVTVNGRGSVYRSADEIKGATDVSGNTRTTTRFADGHETVDQIGGTSAAALVKEILLIPPAFVRELSVSRAGSSGVVTLTGDEVRDGFGGDPLGDREATFYGGYGSAVRFFRPLRDAGDHNDRDDVTPSGNADLQVALTTTNDTVRTVRADADDATPDPNAPANFTADVDAPGSTRFTYSWDFGDGSSGAGATTTHAFAAGHYRVTVTAVGDDGSSGVSDPIEIQVGSPSASATPGPTTTAAPAGAAPTLEGGNDGPGSGDGTRGGGDAAANQGTSGPRKRHGRDDTTQKPRAKPAPTATAAAAQPATAAPTAGAAPTTAPTQPPRKPAPKATATPAPSTAAPKPGRSIDGVLLASAGDPTQVGQVVQSVTATQRTPARRGGGGGGSIAGWVGGGSLLVLLLAGGAAAELRGVRL